MKHKDYKSIAIEWCEKYGIVHYRLKGNMLIYNVSYPAYLNNPRYTIQHKVNLDTLGEETVKLKRYDSKGCFNRC